MAVSSPYSAVLRVADDNEENDEDKEEVDMDDRRLLNLLSFRCNLLPCLSSCLCLLLLRLLRSWFVPVVVVAVVEKEKHETKNR